MKNLNLVFWILGSISIFSTLCYSQVQSKFTEGNLIHLNVNQNEIDLADTVGYWYDREGDIYSGQRKYIDIFQGFKQKFFILSGYAGDTIMSEGWRKIEGVTDGSVRKFSEWEWEVWLYSDMYAFPFRIENGIWLFDNYQAQIFMDKNDSLIIQDWRNEQKLLHIAGIIDSSYLCAGYSIQDPFFFIADLKESPQIDTLSAEVVTVPKYMHPVKIKKIIDSLYFYQAAFSDEIYVFEFQDNQLMLIKKMDICISRNTTWIYKAPYLNSYLDKDVLKYSFSISDTSLTLVDTIFTNVNYVDSELKYAVGISSDTLCAYDINTETIINKWDVSFIDNPQNPLISYPDIYFQQTLKVTALEDEKEIIPQEFEFLAFPNPFNSQVQFRITAPTFKNGKITIYNVLGKETDNISLAHFSQGDNVSWNAEQLSSGVYYVALKTDRFSKTIKLLLLK